MNAIKKARKLITQDPQSSNAATLAHLVRALESEEKFELNSLYSLDYDTFELALEVLKEWRLDRYYSGKVRLHDVAEQMKDF